MFSLANKSSIFLSSASLVLLLGFTLKIDKYETNNLLVHTSGYSRLVIKPESFKKLKISENDWFHYYSEGQKISQLIIHIAAKSTYYEVILSSRDLPKPIYTISYKIGQTNLWSEIFN